MQRIVISFLLLLVATSSWAQKNRTIVLGDSAYKSFCDSLTELGDQEFFHGGDFDKAIDYYLAAYKYGGINAAFMLGRCCAEGLGVDYDMGKAVRFWMQAGKAGSADGAYKVAEALFVGNGVKVDKLKGLDWFEMADSLGSLDATYILGALYRNGESVPKDEKTALTYWKKAADKGHAMSQEALGLEYYEGKMVKRNILEAVKYLKMAADNGRPKAAFYAGLCCEKSYGLPSVDYVSAAYYYMVAADAEIPQAQYHLAMLYTDGKGVDRNLDRATYWLQQAQKNGLKIE